MWDLGAREQNVPNSGGSDQDWMVPHTHKPVSLYCSPQKQKAYKCNNLGLGNFVYFFSTSILRNLYSKWSPHSMPVKNHTE